MYSLILLGMVMQLPEITPLPAGWHGQWKGTLTIKSPGKTSQEIPFELVIKPLDDKARVTWHVIYGEGDKKGTRPYEMVALPGKANRFELDEKSGIRMQMCLQDDSLYCLFKTGNAFLQVKYELRAKDSVILYEISTFEEKDALKTAMERNKKFEVDSYRLTGVQSGTLRKQKQ